MNISDLDIRTLSLLLGTFIGLTVLLIWYWRYEQQQDVWRLLNRHTSDSPTEAKITKKTRWSYYGALKNEAEIIGQPERAQVWFRTAIIALGLPVIAMFIFRSIDPIVAVPVIIAAPLFFAAEVRKHYVRQMRKQTRLAKLMISFLMESGANLNEALKVLEDDMDSPFKERIAEVNMLKKYTTLPEALQELALSTGVSELADFAVLVSEAETFQTPVAEALKRSLALDMQLRDAQADQRYGNIQIRLSMYATVGIAIPGFGFVLYAMVSYVLKLLMNPFVL